MVFSWMSLRTLNFHMGKFLFQLIGTLLTLGIIVYLVNLVFHWATDNSNKATSDYSATAKLGSYDNQNDVLADINDIRLEHNITDDNGITGMNVNIEFATKNMKDEYIYCMVRFYDKQGIPLAQKKLDEKFRSVNGNIITGDLVQITYDCNLSKSTFFMPYEALQISDYGRTDLMLDITLLHYTSDSEYTEVSKSDFLTFYIINEKN